MYISIYTFTLNLQKGSVFMNSSVYNGKNKVRLLIVALILLLPTVLAVYFAFHKDIDTVSAHRVTALSVSSPYGNTASFTDKSSFELYASVLERAQLIDGNYRDLSAEFPYTVTLTENDGVTQTYSFYMLNASDSCIFIDPNGAYYLLTQKDATTLLAREEFASVNSFAVVPFAAVSGASAEPVTLAATSGVWNYLDADGNYASKEIPDVGERTTVRISLSSIGLLSFYSGVQPDTVLVTVSKDGVTRHEGDWANLLNASIMSDSDTEYDLVIRAEWLQKEGAEYYGNVTYTGKLLYDVAPTYSMTNNKINKGDFKAIKIQNFNAGDTLTVSCADYPFPTELKVYRFADGYDYTFLPVQYTYTPATQTSVTFTLSDGSSQIIPIAVREGKNPATTKQEHMVSDAALQTVFSEASFAELDSTIAARTAVSEPAPLWNGRFNYPDAANAGVTGNGMAQYGTHRVVNSLYQKDYLHYGLDIAMNEGDPVYASNTGKVVFAGNLTLTGGTVIIDHGCSIFSYYYHLSSIGVSEGDTVSKGASVGSAGSTGFAVKAEGAVFVPAAQVHFAISINGAYVNPYYLWKYDISYPD